MLKALTYNKLRKYQLISLVIVFITNTTRVLFTGIINEGIMTVLLFMGTVPYGGVVILNPIVTKKYKLSSDEMSRANDLKAVNFTYYALSILFVTILTVTFFTTIEVVMDFSLVFSVYILMQIFKDGYYLFLEREVVSDAGTEDED